MQEFPFGGVIDYESIYYKLEYNPQTKRFFGEGDGDMGLCVDLPLQYLDMNKGQFILPNGEIYDLVFN
jgi:hypothetical protein